MLLARVSLPLSSVIDWDWLDGWTLKEIANTIVLPYPPSYATRRVKQYTSSCVLIILSLTPELPANNPAE